MHKNLRSTANAISNYSFDPTSPTSGGAAPHRLPAAGTIKLDLADGVATGNGTKGPSLEEKMSLLELNSPRPTRNGGGTGEDSSIQKNNLENISRGNYLCKVNT